MKKLIISISALAGLFFYTACSPKKPAVFEQKTGIYFGAATDSLTYSFAKFPKRLSDTLKIPVKVLGDAASTDKTFSIEAATGNGITAIEGVHYKLLNPYSMPAGQLATTIPVVIYRTPGMDTTIFSFKLQLKASDDFETGMTTKSAYLVKLAFLQRPANWGTLSGLDWAGHKNEFGTWTKTKYQLILNALYDPVHDTTVTEFPYSSSPTQIPDIARQYLQIVKNYIRINYPVNNGGTGASLTDPDANNQLIQVGPANY